MRRRQDLEKEARELGLVVTKKLFFNSRDHGAGFILVPKPRDELRDEIDAAKTRSAG